jgi:hypothetical protein
MDSVRARLRLGFVVNFVPTDPPGPWLGSYLPPSEYRTEVLHALAQPGSFWARHNWLPPYISEFVQLARRRHSLSHFDVLFAWELRTTLATVLLCRLTGQRGPRLVSLNPTIKGWSRRALPLVRRLLRDTDCIISFTTDEMQTQCRQLRLPPERFCYVPRFAEPRDIDERSTQHKDPAERFILALGHSNRDFATLWNALEGTDLSVVMYRNSSMRSRDLPNVRPIPRMLPAAEEQALVDQATFHVIPLKQGPYSSGLTVLLRAMGHGKAVVVSSATGIADYTRDGETAVLVPPGDARALREAMLRLWHDSEERQRIGRNAADAVREQFATHMFARQLGEVAQSVMSSRGIGKEVGCVSS